MKGNTYLFIVHVSFLFIMLRTTVMEECPHRLFLIVLLIVSNEIALLSGHNCHLSYINNSFFIIYVLKRPVCYLDI